MIGLSLLLLLACATAAVVAGQWWLDRPAQPGDAQRIFEVTKGQGVGQIARGLADAGFIHQPKLFAVLARYRGIDTKIRAGQYLLSASLSPRQILRRLAEGDAIQIRVTLPEGLTRRDIARVLDLAGVVSEGDFLRASSDSRLIANLGFEGPDLEGFLFPDTYQFARGVSAEGVVRTLAARFRDVADRVLAPALPARGLSLRQAVTLASIVEKETGRVDERPMIAAVFLNRLAKGMRLESDPTVIYGVPDFDGNLTRAHLRAVTPYNTYMIAGLPAGPIANPGEGSLRAVAAPADVSFLFFVSRNDGTHQFSATLAEHERAVQKYQLGHRANGTTGERSSSAQPTATPSLPATPVRSSGRAR